MPKTTKKTLTSQAQGQLDGAVGKDRFNFYTPTATGALRTAKTASKWIDKAYGFKKGKK